MSKIALKNLYCSAYEPQKYYTDYDHDIRDYYHSVYKSQKHYIDYDDYIRYYYHDVCKSQKYYIDYDHDRDCYHTIYKPQKYYINHNYKKYLSKVKSELSSNYIKKFISDLSPIVTKVGLDPDCFEVGIDGDKLVLIIPDPKEEKKKEPESKLCPDLKNDDKKSEPVAEPVVAEIKSSHSYQCKSHPDEKCIALCDCKTLICVECMASPINTGSTCNPDEHSTHRKSTFKTIVANKKEKLALEQKYNIVQHKKGIAKFENLLISCVNTIAIINKKKDLEDLFLTASHYNINLDEFTKTCMEHSLYTDCDVVCEDCRHIICTECSTSVHAQHKKTNLVSFASEIRKNLSEKFEVEQAKKNSIVKQIEWYKNAISNEEMKLKSYSDSELLSAYLCDNGVSC
jgi:hypothetical protein